VSCVVVLAEVEFKYRPPAKKIGMIAGGTGITPMLQILRHILNKEEGNEIEL
jgi:ferredoxin-NADP reductase